MWPVSWAGSTHCLQLSSAFHDPATSNFLGFPLHVWLHFHHFLHCTLRGTCCLNTPPQNHLLKPRRESPCPHSSCICILEKHTCMVLRWAACSNSSTLAPLYHSSNSLWVSGWLNMENWPWRTSTLGGSSPAGHIRTLFSKKRITPSHPWVLKRWNIPDL